MIITDQDKHSAVWVKLKQHFQDRIEMLRLKNDGEIDEKMTQKLRGRIAELKELIDLEN